MKTSSKIRAFGFGLLLALGGVALAATFPYFSPANGILKGSASTYVTTPATSSDVRSLWTGTCNSSTYLRGDGSCTAPAGAGTVTSVALTAPTGFIVTGSPITSSGTLGISTTLNGIVVGDGTGFDIADSSTVIGLWTGTCNSGTYLRADGTCNSPAGAGTVTSVALTVPAGLSITGSPITGSGTLAVTTSLNGPVRGNGTGLTTGNIALASEVSGTLPVGNGGIGTTSITGLIRGNGTSAFTAANSAAVITLWGGTCSSGTFLRGDGSCAAPAGAGTVTSITAGTGITASPGSPITSSGTLLVDQTFSPTWTGSHTFSNVIAANGGISGSGASLTALNASNLASGTVPSARLSGTYSSALTLSSASNVLAGDGSSLTALNASNLTTGTIASGRLTGTYSSVVTLSNAGNSFTGDGSALTALNASNLASGTVPSGRLSGTYSSALTLSSSSNAITANTVSAGTATFTTATVGGSNVCRADGTNCPAGLTTKEAYAYIVPSGGVCTVSFSNSQSNVSSCTYDGTGLSTVQLSAGFTQPPVCTVTATNAATAVSAQINTITSTSVSVRAYTSPSTLADRNYTIICRGT